MVQECGGPEQGRDRRYADRARARDPRDAPGPRDGRAWTGWRVGGRWPSSPRRWAASSATSCSPPSRTWTSPRSRRSWPSWCGRRSCTPRAGRPAVRYLFKHALLEDALYNSLVKGKRQQFHRRIAEVLEVQFPQTVETQPELLAHHFTEAGLTEQAISYWLKAGLRSRERSANVEAIGHLTTGLALLGTLEESPERDAQELQFLNALGTAYIAVARLCRTRSRPDFPPGARAVRAGRAIRSSDSRIMRGIWAWHIGARRLPAVHGSGRRGDGICRAARTTPAS